MCCAGAFHVQMTKDETRDRAIVCRYNPTEVGQYVLYIQWSGDHVPGSPFTVYIVDTQVELARVPATSADYNSASTAAAPLVISGGCPADDACNTINITGTLNGHGDGMFFNDDN